MTGPTLFVPIHLDVLVTDPSAQGSPDFTWLRADYDKLGDLLDPMPGPFLNKDVRPSVPGRSAFLHWALPDALTHGQASREEGTVTFPKVPNRWLVARLDAESFRKGSATFWVIESDYLGEDGTSTFVDPRSASRPGAIKTTRIGKKHTIQEWQERRDPETGQTFLSALSPGNVAFAAFAPFCHDVFSFIDTTIPAAGKLTYLVSGWFSDPADDPLAQVSGWLSDLAAGDPLATPADHPSSFEATLARLIWSVNTAKGSRAADLGPPPTRTLYHACVFDIDPQAPIARSDLSTKVVIGATAIDALATLLESEASDLARKNSDQSWIQAGISLRELLRAASYDLLDALAQPDGRARLDKQCHDRAFGSRPGGTRWEVVARSAESSGDRPALATLPAAQRAAIEAKLARLNADQRKLDTDRRELEGMQRELYHRWWKKQLALTSRGFPEDTTAADARRRARARDEEEELEPVRLRPGQTASPDRPATKESSSAPAAAPAGGWKGSADSRTILQKLGEELDPKREGSLARRVWTLLWKVQTAKLAVEKEAASELGALGLSKLGLELKATSEPGFFHPMDPVVLVKGLKRSQKHGEDGRDSADGTLSCRFARELLRAGAGAAPAAPAIPGVSTRVPAVDEAVAGLLAEIYWHDKPSPSGTRPVDFSFIPFEQAWSPLFLEWEMKVYPSGAAGEDARFRYDPRDFFFDGKDYSWNGATPPATSLSTSGRGVLTPHASMVFRDKLKKYLAESTTENKALAGDLLDRIGSWDVVSQACSGLSDALVTLDTITTFPPGDRPPTSGAFEPVADPRSGSAPDIRDLVRDQYHTVPRRSDDGASFFPVRAGLCELTQLAVIDCFGQSVQIRERMSLLVDPSLSPPPKNLPAPADGGISYIFQLPPRLVQPARLGVSLLSAADPRSDILTSPEPDPLSGWLLPNHLDEALSVYTSDGKFVGEIVADRPGEWDGALEALEDPSLRAVVQAFMNQRERLPDILAVIDETSWMVDPLGARKDEIRSVIMGRPLAIMRARVELCLDGPPLQDQRITRMWGPGPENLPLRDSGGVEALTFPVRLGSFELRDDGLMGYFVAGDASSFHAVHKPESITDSVFIQKIDDGNYLPVGVNGSVEVILIVDPRGKVHASSGILPVVEVELPAHTLERLLGQLCIKFRVGPVFGDATRVSLPLPAVTGGQWQFLPDSLKELAIPPRVLVAGLPETPRVIHAGWLDLDLQDQGSDDVSP